MAATIQDFVNSIATKASVTHPRQKPPSEYFIAIQQEGDATKVGQLFNQIPGAADLAQS